MRKFALIVAGGVGARMGTEVPKQFLEIAHKPILMWTLERFLAFDSHMELILVLPENQLTAWAQLCDRFQFKPSIKLAKGGNSRFQSVKNGLNEIQEDGIVFIHDGVRPLVSLQTLQNCFVTAVEKGNALPVSPVVESIRKVEGEMSKHVDRNHFRLVQTPQTFQVRLVKEAYHQPEQEFFTDDASVCEAMGIAIHLVNGNPENIKITNPADLLIAESLLTQ